jgi:GntR family transcriptional regulator
MFIVISALNPDPLYKQVTNQIKDAIANGSVEPNMKLPSIRAMSEELKISPITIKRAYTDLEKEGYIITRAGLGSFVADVNHDKLRAEKLAEISKEIDSLLIIARKFGISKDEIMKIFKEKKQSEGDKNDEQDI